MKQYALIILFCFLSYASYAQDMASLFAGMPDRYLPQLESAWRKDLIDLYSSGKTARLENMISGYSELKMLTTDYLLLQTTERSTLEMKLLPLVNNTYIICAVSTVYAPTPDSRVLFFSPEWEVLEVGDMFVPPAADWFLKEDADRESDAYPDAVSRLDMELIHYRLDPESLKLTAVYTTSEYLSKEDREKVAPYLKTEPKVYIWEKYRFKE
ncbi:MAG: DUF3256 family protein [Tannerellaceae bacterium]|jgi:hypothetical protein|nr:DUF3256 family protein [Tannerellaceae bacterium]